MIYSVDKLCVGRDGRCIRFAARGDYCRSCWEALPRCAICGHHVDAHDEGACAVGHHEGAAGPECDCQGFVHPDDLDDGGLR